METAIQEKNEEKIDNEAGISKVNDQILEPIISIKGVNFTYNKGKDNEFQALININLDIYPEEFVIIFGPSGCGKSTMLNIIAGLEKPEEGEVRVLGQDLVKMNKKDFAVYHRRQIGMIYQAYNLITSLSVLDNVALPQIFINVRKGKRNKWAMSLLERFGIEKQAKKIPTELSGGQQQRIGIARAIVNNPQIILADEPVGNLDSVSAKNVLDIMAELNEKEKKTVIMVTHNPENLIYGDRIIYMRDGVIVREERVSRKEKKEKKEMLIKAKTPVVEIKDLMRAYQGLTPEQINILILPYKAKIFAHHFITTRNLEETKSFEEIIQRKLLGTITDEDFFDVLHSNSQEGGVGFNRQTAERIVKRTNGLIRITYFIYQKYHQRKNEKGGHDKVSEEEKTKRVLNYLLNTCYRKHKNSLSPEQLDRLAAGIAERLKGNIQKVDFFRLLDLPLKKGGVGLNSKTAKAISEEMELILILGFGITHQPKTIKKDADQTKGNQLTETEASLVEGDSERGNINFLSAGGDKIKATEKNELFKKEKEELALETEKVSYWPVQDKADLSSNISEELRKAPSTLADAIASAQEHEEAIKNEKPIKLLKDQQAQDNGGGQKPVI